MSQPSYSRRQLLYRGGTGALAGMLAGVSGCSAAELGADDSPEVPYYATWAPTPDRIYRDTDNQGDTAAPQPWYSFRARRFDELATYLRRRNESFEDTALYRDGKAHPVLDIDPSEAGTEIRFGERGISVLETGLPDGDIIRAFQTPEASEHIREPFEMVGEYEGYQLLAGAGGDWVVGVNAGLLVEAFTTGGLNLLSKKRDVVEAVIDARAGDKRYTDAEATLAELVKRLGTGMLVSVDPPVQDTQSDTETGKSTDPIASGVAYSSAETTNATQTLAFASRAAASEFADTPTTDTNWSWSEVSVTQEGRYVSIRGTHHPVTR